MMSEYSKSLTRVGLHPEDGDRNNLRQLLKLYQEKEEELQRTEGNQKRELKGVENYIESIRKVSEERDAITEELEAENEALKDEVKQLRQELNGRNHEIKEVLKQSGLVDLAEGSPGEAVAYLMIERSRLMDDINQLKKLNEATSVDEANNHLAKDIKLLKDELVEEKLKFGIKEDKLKLDLKNQIALAEGEKEKALHDSKEKEKKIKDLQGEVKKLKLSLIIEKRRKKNEDPGNALEGNTQQKGLSDGGESKIPILTAGKARRTNNENEATRVKELTAALETEKKRKSSYEATIIKLKTLQDKNKKDIASLQHDNHELERENQSLEARLNEARSEAKLSTTREQESLNQDSRSVSQLYRELEQLRKQNETRSAKLQTTMISLEDEKKKCGRLEQTLKETEKKWEGVVDRYKTNEQDLKTKLNQLNKELEAAKDDMAASHREIMKLKGEQERVMDSNKSESHQLHIHLLREQEQVRELKRQLERADKVEAKVEDLKKDRDVLAKELQVMITKENTNQASAMSLEVLRNENKALKDELSGNHKKQSDLYEDLTKLQSKHRDVTLELKNATATLRTSEETISFLRGELSRKSKELIDTFDFSREGQSKIELEVVNLQRNIDEERKSFTKDNCDLKLRLEVEEKKNEELNRILKEKTEEIASLRREVGRLSLSSTRLDERLQEEIKQRQTVDSRNKVLEEELAKLWSQLKEVMDKHAANELSKTELEGELFRLTNLMKEHDSHRAERQAENSAAISALSRAQQRAQLAERKIPELQEELDTTLLKLETAQSHANDVAVSMKEAQMLKEDLIKIKLQLQEEKVQSSMIAKQLEDSQEHLKVAEERKIHLEEMNSKLKHQLLTVQSELTAIEDKHKNVEDLHLISEQGKQTLQERAVELQTEVTRLQMELSQTANQLDNQNRKYMNLKLQTKEKMENARDIFNRHKAVLVENIQQVQTELSRVKGDLEKERSVKDDIKKNNDTLLSDNRQLMEKMAEREESLSDQGRNISSLEYRTKFLEQENGMLQDRISSLTRQRMALEKVVREFRMEKQKEDIYKAIGNTTSGQPLATSSVLGPGLGIPKTPYSSGLGNSVSNSILSGANINRPGVGLLVETSTSSPAPRMNGFSIGVNSDSPRLGVESDGMSADTEGR